MAMIHVNRDRGNLGQFPPEEIAAGLASARFLPTDLAWREGMESWQPLSTFTDLPEPEALPPDLPAPAETAAPVPAPEPPGSEPAWERREELGVVAAGLETIKGVFLSPASTFRNLKKSGGFLDPLMFAYPMNVVCGLVALLYQQAYWRFLPPDLLPKFGDETLDQTPASLIYVIPMLLIGYLIQPFLIAGLCQLGLTLIGGVKGGYETTFRVVCYLFGAFAVVALVPFPPFEAVQAGLFLLALVASVSYLTIGFREAHRIPTPAALAAALLPPTLCCACLLAVAAGVAAMYAGAAAVPH